jgi:hypothetical protein
MKSRLILALLSRRVDRLLARAVQFLINDPSENMLLRLTR